MVAVVAVLMVGGEYSSVVDSMRTRSYLGFLNPLVPSVAHGNGQETSALDNKFALIDEYIAADLSSRPNYPLQLRGGPYIVGTIKPYRLNSGGGQKRGSGIMVCCIEFHEEESLYANR